MLETALETLTLFYRLRVALQRHSTAAVAMAEHRRAFYEQAWREAAANIGCQFAPLGDDIFEVSRAQRRIKVCLNFSPLDDSVTLRLAGRKPAVYRILAELGMPVPTHVAIHGLDFTTASRFARTVGGPLVVKPAFGTGAGDGVTTNVFSQAQLSRAIAWARAFCPEILVERQVAGANYRLLYLDGQLIDCIVRRPPTVIGDGSSSLRKLVRRENAHRVATGISIAQTLLPADLDMKNFLAAQNMSLGSVPAKGQAVVVKGAINGNRADDNETALSTMSEAVIEMGWRIISRLGIRLAGVDIITPDPKVGLREAGGAVVDINTTPGFYYHYNKKDGEFAAAVAVLRAALGDVENETRLVRA